MWEHTISSCLWSGKQYIRLGNRSANALYTFRTDAVITYWNQCVEQLLIGIFCQYYIFYFHATKWLQMWLSGVGLDRIYNMLLKWCRKKTVKDKIKGNKTDLLYERDLNDTLYETSKFHDLQMASRGFTSTSDWTWWMTCEGEGLPSYQAGISECLCFKGCVRMRAFSWEVFLRGTPCIHG